MAAREKRYWLFKSEPDVFSFDDLWKAKGRRTSWGGVRNYQARNLIRDEMQAGDGVLFYHSSSEPTGVAGIAELSTAAYADPTQFDRRDDAYDPKSKREAPTWLAVDIKAVRRLERFVTLAELRATPELAAMGVLRRGNRLSVQPVTRAEWLAVERLAGSKGLV